ncbi:ATP-binding protein [Burkholderia gladioli]|uniref:ATP-binding protein n=1 Tax=Burkholderia gladioli TaxID=28095 RepID=UPI00301AEBE2
MTENEFRELLALGERDWLDFKRDGYGDLTTSAARNEFTKDVLAMANTPRDVPARLVLGVSWTAETGSVVYGLEEQLDDQKFQNAVGVDRVQPIPRFVYIPHTFEGKQVGVIEIPIDDRGPFTPVKDIERLQAGAIYFRRGTTSERAVGDEILRIVKWFMGGEIEVPLDDVRDWWAPFLDAVRRFERGPAYLLVADRFDQNDAGFIQALGAAPWRAVTDFDPESDVSGLLKLISGTLERHRTIHKVARGEYAVRPEPGIHWFFARGIVGGKDVVTNSDHKTWIKLYKLEIGKQLHAIAGAINPSPVVAVVLWEDVLLKNHLRTILEEMTGMFGDALEIVLVTRDQATFQPISDDAGATLVKMSRRSLLSGLAVHFADQEAGYERERCVLATPTGASVELSLADWLWLSEDLEILHRGTGMSGADGPDEFRRGGDATWRDLQLHHDCDRDVTIQLRTQIDEDLRRRQTVRINLYHTPGGGGTTVGQRAAWEVHNTSPVCVLTRCAGRETADKIAKIAALTEATVLVLVDGGRHSERDIDDLFDFLKAAQTPAVLLQVLRRFTQHPTGKRRFWLDAELSDHESDRFRVAYTKAALHRVNEIQALASHKRGPDRTAFFFGLTAFENDFRGLPRYVYARLEGLSDQQKDLLAYLAIAHYYGQQAIPAQAFVRLLGVPQTKQLDLRSVFGGQAAKALDLVVETAPGTWRAAHPLISLEILKRLLSPAGAPDANTLWRQNLSKWSKKFCDLCSMEGYSESETLLELARRVFIYRDNVEVLGTERAGSTSFSHLIDDIPSDAGRVDVLRHLTECFPGEAHFHAHLGRFLGAKGHFEDALEAILTSISIQPDDPVLHHMRGMILRQKMKSDASAGAPIEQLVEVSKEASFAFERSRSLAPDLEHGYISEVQLLLELIDRAKAPALTSPTSAPFLREAMDRAEDLLDQLQHLYAGEEPSNYVLDCQARILRLYGDFQKSLQGWDNLLARPDVSKPPIRRQIVWTILRRHEGKWEKLTQKEAHRIKTLLEENLEENTYDSTSLRLWLRVVRHLPNPPSLEAITERVGYWKANTGSLDAAFYLYAFHFLRALQGSSQALLDMERALDECKSLARYRRDRTRSSEWIGVNNGIGALVHQSQLGEWAGDFWTSTQLLRRISGRISSIDGPQKGTISIDGGISAFFVPAKSDVHEGRDENSLVTCYVGLSYDGPRAWDVRLANSEGFDVSP